MIGVFIIINLYSFWLEQRNEMSLHVSLSRSRRQLKKEEFKIKLYQILLLQVDFVYIILHTSTYYSI